MNLKEAISEANVRISEIADCVGVSYFEFGQMVDGEVLMPKKIKNEVKNFLIKNYTNRIDEL